MSRTGKTPVYNHVWYQPNQAKIYPQSGESPKVFAVSGCNGTMLYLNFLWLLDIEMVFIFEILTEGKGLFYRLIVSTMAADALVTQGARASTAMVLT